MQLTTLALPRRLRRVLTTSGLALTLTAVGSGALPLLPSAAAQPHPVRTAVHTVSLTAPTMAVPRGAKVPALTAAALARATADGAPAPAGLRPAVASGPLNTSAFSLVGVTWDGRVPAGSFAAWVRTRASGVWSDWSALPQESDEHAPDPGTAEAAHERAGTDPVVVAPSDGVEVRVDTRSGTAPAGLRVALVAPGTSDADASVGTAVPGSASAAAARPVILSRKQWGADESLVRAAPSYGTVKGAFVHHTVSANNYTAGQVPGILRGIFAYHVDEPGLERHRLQLPGRPLRPHLGGPRRRRGPCGDRRPHHRLQRRGVRHVGDRQLQHGDAAGGRGQRLPAAVRVEVRHPRRQPAQAACCTAARPTTRSSATVTSTAPSARASACTTCCRRSAPAPSPAWAAAPRRVRASG